MDWQTPIAAILTLGAGCYLLMRVVRRLRPSATPSKPGCGSCSAGRNGATIRPLIELRPLDPDRESPDRREN